MELVAPAGNLLALKTAVNAGADAVYIGLKNATNARNFSGLNFTEADIRSGIQYARQHKRKVMVAINTFPQAGRAGEWRATVDAAHALGADAVILADPGLLAYAADRYPAMNRHLSVQGSATHADAIELMREQFGIVRAVLPRVLALADIERLIQHTSVPLEVFGFGSLCVMAEGRCLLSSFATGDSPNNKGVCSPAHAVRWLDKGNTLEARLGGIMIDAYGPGESAGYPTLCKGRFEVEGEVDHVLENPTSLNSLDLLPRLLEIGVSALKIEGRQRSPAYVKEVVSTLRAAIDALKRDPARYAARSTWHQALSRHAEGEQVTQGAYDRPWK
ncbi:U32 family peptidase [Burkholderiaceae bacterium DAT-1]|nr:U32 family peptidase [Burkholderiaceae bacterium DAT-1]